MAEFDINKVKGNDRFIAGGAVLLFIISFLHWVTVSSPSINVGGQHIGGGHVGVKLWSAYGWNKTALILALLAGALVIARLMGALDNVSLPAGVNLITLGLTGLATVIFLLRFLFAFKSEGGFGVKISTHPALFWYVGLAVSGAMTYFAFLNFKSSGEALPTQLQGIGGTSAPATPPGYSPPAAPMTPQGNVAPPTEAIAPPTPPPGQEPGYPKTGP